uniref:Uncharacterized protein n=1 Tax=Brassica campestris TaxID=3711 RepID=M4F5L2_BRACM
MPSQSRTCRYVHGVDVTYRIREMEKVKPEPPRSSPPFINTTPCWTRALVQPRDVKYDIGDGFVVGEIEIHGGTLVFLVIKSSDPFRVLNISKGLWRGALSSGYQYIRNCDLLIAIIKVSITITYELKFSGLLFLVVVIMTQSQLVSLLERLGMGRTVREITSI